MMRGSQRCKEGEAASSQHQNLNRTSRLPSDRVVLLVLGSLLAAALIVIYRLSTHLVQTKENLQRITQENQVLMRKLSDESSCENVWIHFQGTCYYFSTNRFSWEESRNRCREDDAELVKVDTREEQFFLRGHLNGRMRSFDDMFWIGLADSAEEGRWVWVDGSKLSGSLEFWSKHEPDNWAEENPEGEDCVRMGMEGGGGPMNNWFDKDCSIPQKRICEKRPAGMKPE